MTEYLIIVAMIAVASIALFSFFGATLRSQIAAMANEIAGVSSTANITAARSAAARATTEGRANRNMGTFDAGATKAATGTN